MLAGAKHWHCPEPRQDLTELICRELSILPPVAGVLVNRGISTPEEAEIFLNPSLNELHSSFKMKGMAGAADRIKSALETKEKILVYGDYDADGVTASALLTSSLKRLGGKVDYYLPSRFQDGYGLQQNVIEQYKKEGYSLIITVDCGINAVEEVSFCREHGVDIIITDHHYPLKTVNGAVAVINPRQPDCPYPWKSLAGVGIAFKLLCALVEKTGENLDPFDYLDMVALGTVADIVPLQGENRILTTYGLEKINRNPNPGLKALIECAGMSGRMLSSRDLAFGLAPSVNAAGRLGEAYPAANLLLSEKEEDARELAEFLVNENQNRRSIETAVYEEAREIIQKEYNGEPGDVIVLEKEGWHFGVIGIVASKLSDLYYRPVVLITQEGETGKGSARSIPGFDITEALSKCGHLLERFGGHEQAAGITIKSENTNLLREQMNCLFCNRLKPEDLVPRLTLDGELEGPEIDLKLTRQLEMLAPFGAGNEYPRFYTRNWQVRQLRLVGKDRKHLKLSLNKDHTRADPIFFSADTYMDKIKPGSEIDMVVTLKNGTWQERPVLNMEIKDLSYSQGESAEGVELTDGRNKNKKAYLKGIPVFAAEPIIYIGKKEQEAEIEKELHKTSRVRFIHPGSEENTAGIEVKDTCDVVFFHLPMLPEFMERVIKMCPAGLKIRVHLLYNHQDKLFNEKILKATLPSLNNVKELFSLMKEMATGNNLFYTDNFSVLSQKVSFPLTQTMRERCISILKETELVKPVSADSLAISTAEFPADNELAETKTCLESREIEKKCVEFQHFLMDTNLDSLCQYIKKLHNGKTSEDGGKK